MGEAWRFLVLFAASYTLSLSLFATFTLAGMGPYVAKLITDSACFFFNFLVMRLWVYRPQNAQEEKAEAEVALASGRLPDGPGRLAR